MNFSNQNINNDVVTINKPDASGHPPGHTKPEKPDLPVRPEHPHHPNEPLTIIVNGVDQILPSGTKRLSYEEVVRLAYGKYDDASSVIYTVSFSNGPTPNPKGTLVKGKNVKIGRGMIFNVSRSDKS